MKKMILIAFCWIYGAIGLSQSIFHPILPYPNYKIIDSLYPYQHKSGVIPQIDDLPENIADSVLFGFWEYVSMHDKWTLTDGQVMNLLGLDSIVLQWEPNYLSTENGLEIMDGNTPGNVIEAETLLIGAYGIDVHILSGAVLEGVINIFGVEVYFIVTPALIHEFYQRGLLQALLRVLYRYEIMPIEY